MNGGIYSKPVAFALLAAAVILIGTLVTTFVPMASEQMHPRLESLKPFSPMELAGRDIYQREGCVNCHTQTVRPLRAEVMRYGEYSKAGEFAYDRPFLWGSKRTGPDLARVGLRYPESMHYRHFEDPQSVVQKTNMPAYGWLKDYRLDPVSVMAHMDALNLPYSQEEIDALEGKNELDALVAYMLSLGHAVRPEKAAAAADEAHEVELSMGASLYADNCAGCHGDDRSGGYGPNLVGIAIPEGDLKAIILKGTGRGMPGYEGTLTGEQVDALADFLLGLETPATPVASKGAGLYADNCAGCHGENGTGGYGPDLTDNIWLGKDGDIEDSRLSAIIADGTEGGMPPFAIALGPEGLDELVKYIRSLVK